MRLFNEKVSSFYQCYKEHQLAPSDTTFIRKKNLKVQPDLYYILFLFESRKMYKFWSEVTVVSFIVSHSSSVHDTILFWSFYSIQLTLKTLSIRIQVILEQVIFFLNEKIT